MTFTAAQAPRHEALSPSARASRTALVRRSPKSGPVRPTSRPSAARAAAAARVVGSVSEPQASAERSVVAGDAAPEVPRRPYLRVVDRKELSPAQRQRRARRLLVASGAALVTIAFALVYLHVVLSERQFVVDRLATQVRTDQASYNRLRLQVAELGSPQNIISTAEGQLGMREPTSVSYLSPKAVVGGARISGPGLSSQVGITGLAGAGSAGSAKKPGHATAAGPAVPAPAGDADWPQIKSRLAGSP